MVKKYNKGVLLIETIPKSEKLKETESLFHLLNMTNFPPKLKEIKVNKNKEEFIELFTRNKSKRRYIHISSHGNENGFFINGNIPVIVDDFKDYNKKNGDILDGAMEGRFLTISACGSISNEFLKNLHELLKFEAVISPMNEVSFDESAIFFINFYFNLSRISRSTQLVETDIKLVDFIDTFQKTKIGYLLQGGLGGMRLFYSTGEPGKLATII